MIETLITLVPIALATLGTIAAFSRALWQAYSRLEARFDHLEEEIRERAHKSDIEIIKLRSEIKEIDHRLENATAHRMTMEAKFYRIENAILSMSGALKKFTDYSPRGPEDWPTEDAPTELRNRGRREP